jgi:tRNA(adenine34) deaminase
MTAEIHDVSYMHKAMSLALEAERNGNLPIGAIIVLDGGIIAQGKNTIWQPQQALTRHAEMEALRAIPTRLWAKSREMTLYTTLEPCLMCAGAILLHHLGRLVFGSSDPWGGVASCLDTLPGFFRDEFAKIEWVSPALPDECDLLYARILQLEHRDAA